jgi:hypothetical protein
MILWHEVVSAQDEYDRVSARTGGSSELLVGEMITAKDARDIPVPRQVSRSIVNAYTGPSASFLKELTEGPVNYNR